MSEPITSLTPFVLGHGGVKKIQCRVSCVEPNRLRITFLVTGDIGTLKIPAKCSPHHVDRLWDHTCFEAFVRADGDSSYYEFNFSPSSEWAAYAFRAYRGGAPIRDDGLSPDINVRCTHERFEMDALVRLDRLPAISAGSRLRIGLSAVIEANNGALYYWALKHPAAQPDFHHPDSFALELAFPSQSA
jgi:hypothetical protein